MRLLIISPLSGQGPAAAKIAMSGGAKVSQVDDVAGALASLRAGHGADLLMVDVGLDIAGLVTSLRAERIHVPVVACGIGTDTAAAVRAIKAGAKEDIPPPPPGQPMISVNCAAIPDNLLESELFGHEKGAFTGAVARRVGKFEEANGGTLLLDEISEMDLRLQAKLLRAIQEREIDRVGGSSPIKIDIRILATTNRDLEADVRSGRFREDLFFRLNVVALRLPPLRERPQDLEPLAAHVIRKYAEANGVPARALARESLDKLRAHGWRGNLRDLENAMHRAVLLAQGDSIGPEAIHLSGGSVLHAETGARPTATAAAPGAPTNMVGRTVADVERDLILETLTHFLGNHTHAANILALSIRTLRNKLKLYSEQSSPVAPHAGDADRPHV